MGDDASLSELDITGQYKYMRNDAEAMNDAQLKETANMKEGGSKTTYVTKIHDLTINYGGIERRGGSKLLVEWWNRYFDLRMVLPTRWRGWERCDR